MIPLLLSSALQSTHVCVADLGRPGAVRRRADRAHIGSLQHPQVRVGASARFAAGRSDAARTARRCGSAGGPTSAERAASTAPRRLEDAVVKRNRALAGRHPSSTLARYLTWWTDTFLVRRVTPERLSESTRLAYDSVVRCQRRPPHR